jgi:hypothetical protein
VRKFKRNREEAKDKDGYTNKNAPFLVSFGPRISLRVNAGAF